MCAMRYLPHLLKMLRKYHTGWKITLLDYDGEYYDSFTLTENMTEYDLDSAYSEVEIDDWDVEDNGEDQPTIYLYSNIEPVC